MKAISFILCFLLFASGVFAQNRITVSSDPGFAANEHNLQTAINNAASGSILYVHPGNYGNITLNKQLIIYGPGYFLGANSETQANLNLAEIAIFTIAPTAAGSYVSGIHITNKCYIQANDIWMRGNYLKAVEDNGLHDIQNLNFVGNYVQTHFNFGYGSKIANSFFENNFIGDEFQIWSNVINLSASTLKNNIFGGYIVGAQTSTFMNNIFLYDTSPGGWFGCSVFIDSNNGSCYIAQAGNNTIVNNVFVGSSFTGAASVASNNQFNVPIGTIFGSTYPNGDAGFALAQNSPAKATNNGTNPPVDYGIFGGTLANRYKLSGQWDNPAIYEITMPSSGTNTGGIRCEYQSESTLIKTISKLAMKTKYIFLYLIFYISKLCSQTITNMEYFIDTDPGFGNATQIVISPNANINTAFNVNLSSVSNGLHNLYVRVKDNAGHWSHLNKMPFFRHIGTNIASSLDIVAMEYFIDNDPGFGNGISIPMTIGANINTAFNINLSSVTNGLHNLYIRAKDNAGRWSHVNKHTFFRNQGNMGTEIIAMEYFIDTDPGLGNATAVPVSIPNNGVVDINGLNIPLSGLSIAYHNLYFRTQDKAGRWSLLSQKPFIRFGGGSLTGNHDVIAMEYFIDTEPGLGNGTPVAVATPLANINETLTLNLSNLSPNICHQIYVRMKDNNEQWSFSIRDSFYVSNNTPFSCLQFPLPIDVELKANPIQMSVWLSWVSHEENSISYYQIQRSEDGNNFVSIQEIANTFQNNYSIIDSNVFFHAESYFYRIKIIDIDGNETFTNVENVKLFSSEKYNLEIYPNPTEGILHISYDSDEDMDISISLYNVAGQRVKEWNIETLKGHNEHTLTVSDLSEGIYLLKTNINGKTKTAKVIIL